MIDCEIDLALVEGPVDDPRIIATPTAGLGVAMLPLRAVRELLHMGELRALSPPRSAASAFRRPLLLL